MVWVLLVKQIQGQQDGRAVCRIRMEALDSEQPAHEKSSEVQRMHPVLSCGGVWSEKLERGSTAACEPSEASEEEQHCSTWKNNSTWPGDRSQFAGSFTDFKQMKYIKMSNIHISRINKQRCM